MKAQMTTRALNKRAHIDPKTIFALIVVIFGVALLVWVMNGKVSLPNRNSLEAVPAAIIDTPNYSATIDAVKEELTLTKQQLSQNSAELTQTREELAQVNIEIETLKSAQANNADPPVNVEKLLESQADLADRVAILETEQAKHLEAGGYTKLGNQAVAVQSILGWKLITESCDSWGPYDESILTNGKTFLIWEGSDWAHSTCFVDFEGWDPSLVGTDFYVAMKFEFRFSFNGSWEPNSYYIEAWRPFNEDLRKMITLDVLGNPDPDVIVGRFYGNHVTTWKFQDHGYFRMEKPRTMGSEEVVYRLYPITEDQRNDLMLSEKVAVRH